MPSMKTFSYRYFGLLVLLFVVWYWDGSPVAIFVNHYQTKWTLFFLDLGLQEGQLKGIDIMINPHYKIIVTKACNGMIPIWVLSSAILSYPVVWVYRARWIFLEYMVLTGVNIARLLMVAHFVKRQSDFPLYHDLFGNFLLVVTVLLLFYFFLRGARSYHSIR